MYRYRLAVPLLALLPLAAACGDDDDGAETQTPAATGMSASQMAGEGDAPAFALVRGQDTLLVERYTLSGNRVTGVLRDPQGSSVEYETVHGTGGGERSMRITLRPANPNAGPPIVSTFTLRGDSAYLVNSRGDSSEAQADAAPAGTLPYMSPSMGMMALLARSARSMVGDSGQVTILAAAINQSPVIVSPLVFWRADTAWVIGNESNQFRLVFSGDRLVSAENAPQNMRAVPITGVAAAAEPAETPAQASP